MVQAIGSETVNAIATSGSEIQVHIVCVSACVCTHACLSVCLSMHVYVHAHMGMYMHVCAHVYALHVWVGVSVYISISVLHCEGARYNITHSVIAGWTTTVIGTTLNIDNRSASKSVHYSSSPARSHRPCMIIQNIRVELQAIIKMSCEITKL